jgi:hypothetical protein
MTERNLSLSGAVMGEVSTIECFLGSAKLRQFGQAILAFQDCLCVLCYSSMAGSANSPYYEAIWPPVIPVAAQKPFQQRRASTILAEAIGKYTLDQHAQALAEHSIACGIVSGLTEDHLESLGISLGYSNKLLKAIDCLTFSPARHPENKHDSER